MTGHRGIHFAVNPGPAAPHRGDGRGVLVRVTDGEPAVGPLDQQQLRAGSSGRRGLRQEDGAARFRATARLDRTSFGVTNKKGMVGRTVDLVIEAVAQPA